MIPMIHDSVGYMANTLSATVPRLDIGTAEAVFERAGLTGTGRKQKEFIALAKGKLVVRSGFSFSAVDRLDLVALLERADKPSRG